MRRAAAPPTTDVAQSFSTALAESHLDARFTLPPEDFEATTSAGRSRDAEGDRHGRVAMITFAHARTVENDRITALQQITDTVGWPIRP